MPAPEMRTVAMPDGQALSVWHWPRKPGRPLVHWAHATGFHARTYTPLLEQLAEIANVIAWDMRGHGASGEVRAHPLTPPRPLSWSLYYRDLCALIDTQTAPIWLAGHSIGATASAMAATRRPEAVRGVLLVEPVLLDRRERLYLAASKAIGQAHRVPLAAGALRRRAVFPDRAAAFENYRRKKAFSTWPDTWLEAYVEHGFIDTDEGVRLACDPSWECATFAATEHKPWSTLRHLTCPVVALAAERASTFPPSAQHRLQRLLSAAEIQGVAGTTHFLPMEQPQAVLDGLSALLSDSDTAVHI